MYLLNRTRWLFVATLSLGVGSPACSTPPRPADVVSGDTSADQHTEPDGTEADAGDASNATDAMDATDSMEPDDAATVDAGDGAVSAMDSGDATALSDADASAMGDAAPDGGVVLVDAACNGRIESHTILESPHVDVGTAITWNSNPPSSGPHFGIWARWGVYAEPVPRGYLVHSLEHGAVVIGYNCARRTSSAACTAMHDRLAAFVAALPPEPRCLMEGVRRRIILTPDPLLASTVGASAWGNTYRADCVDERALETFVLSLTGRAPEDFCFDGSYPDIAPDAGPDAATDASSDVPRG
ncbi:MAG: DUF3105 domain-containing protein [Deltaproteobacteria bacterium]|nr:DUF3105 domain-containing protein [Deltaproteobacteria bacterium]